MTTATPPTPSRIGEMVTNMFDLSKLSSIDLRKAIFELINLYCFGSSFLALGPSHSSKSRT